MRPRRWVTSASPRPILFHGFRIQGKAQPTVQPCWPRACYLPFLSPAYNWVILAGNTKRPAHTRPGGSSLPQPSSDLLCLLGLVPGCTPQAVQPQGPQTRGRFSGPASHSWVSFLRPPWATLLRTPPPESWSQTRASHPFPPGSSGPLEPGTASIDRGDADARGHKHLGTGHEEDLLLC